MNSERMKKILENFKYQFGYGIDALPKTVQQIEKDHQYGQNIGAQVYVSRDGMIEADFALGLANENQPMKTDTIMLWLSASKPLASIMLGKYFETR